LPKNAAQKSWLWLPGRDGVALVRRLGADAAVDGHSGDFVEAAFKFAPKGVDAVRVLGSEDSVLRCFDALRKAAGSRIRTASIPNQKNGAARRSLGVTRKWGSANLKNSTVLWRKQGCKSLSPRSSPFLRLLRLIVVSTKVMF
jgi:NADPH:quinone reductase-like Zn-dependent oxidoreductase